MKENEKNSFYPKTRNAWRKWLDKNHLDKKNIWLVIYHKKSGKPTVTYEQAVEEALCFGWIDSRPNKRDSESSYLFFSPRKPKSVWSKLNKERIEKLARLKLIRPAGHAMINLAKKTGTWDALNDVDNMVVPDDLQKAFSKNKKAHTNFEKFPPSSRKIILGWIGSAKQTVTREKRIKETVILAAKNIRANHYKR